MKIRRMICFHILRHIVFHSIFFFNSAAETSLAQTDRSKHKPPQNIENKRQCIRSRRLQSAFSPASCKNRPDRWRTSRFDMWHFWFPSPRYTAARDSRSSDSERRKKYSYRWSTWPKSRNSSDCLFLRKHTKAGLSLSPGSRPATDWSWWSPAVESERVWESSMVVYKKNKSTDYDHNSWKAHE